MNRFLVIFALIVAYMPIQSIAAPSSEYWDIWDKSDENSITKKLIKYFKMCVVSKRHPKLYNHNDYTNIK